MRMRNHSLLLARVLTGKTLSRAIVLFACAAMAVVATGCAFSRTETPVTFAPKINQPLKAERKNSVTVGAFKDSRAVKDGNVLIHKQNEYGTTSGAYVTKTPVTDILKSGIADAFQQNGFTSSAADKYELRGDLQEFTLEGVGGFWKATVKPKLAVRFELVDKATDQPVWHDTLIGHTTGQTAWGDKEFLGKMFSESADDLVTQLISDKTFRNFFE
jgi:ABC-type uncharacterized transport system auxiliary subunit